MDKMFEESDFNNDSICDWDVSKVTSMKWMFRDCCFNQDISNWKINRDCYTNDMFKGCEIKDEYKPFQDGKRVE